MFQLRLIHIPCPSRKQIILGSLGGSVVIAGIIVAVAFFIVATIIHPKKKTLFDRYTLSPFELDIPAEAVTFPPLCGDYKVSGWYIPYPEATTTILVCPGFHTRAADVLAVGAHLWKAGHSVLVFFLYSLPMLNRFTCFWGERSLHCMKEQ